MSQNETTTVLVTDAKNLTLIDATRENPPWWSQPNYFEVVLFRCCFLLLLLLMSFFSLLLSLMLSLLFVTLYVDLRLLLIEVELGW